MGAPPRAAARRGRVSRAARRRPAEPDPVGGDRGRPCRVPAPSNCSCALLCLLLVFSTIRNDARDRASFCCETAIVVPESCAVLTPAHEYGSPRQVPVLVRRRRQLQRLCLARSGQPGRPGVRSWGGRHVFSRSGASVRSALSLSLSLSRARARALYQLPNESL